jgi:hypothetical protein
VNFIYTGAGRQISQGFFAGAASSHFQVGPVEFPARASLFDANFIGYLAQRASRPMPASTQTSIKSAASGKLKDLALAARGHPAQNQIRQVAGHKSGHQGKNNSWVLSALLAVRMERVHRQSQSKRQQRFDSKYSSGAFSWRMPASESAAATALHHCLGG